MAREHARILSRIWSDRDFIARSPEAQRMYLLLLSQRSLNHVGVAPLTLQRWANTSPDTTTDDVLRWLEELEQHRFIAFDPFTEEVLIRSFIRNDGVVKQPNVLKAALRLAREVDSEFLREMLADELVKLGIPDAFECADDIRPESNGLGSRTRREPVANPSETPTSEPFAKGSEKTRGKGEGETPVVATSEVVGGSGLPAQKSRARGNRLPDDFAVTPEMVVWFNENCPNIDGRIETEQFKDHWHAESGAKASKRDWVAAWRKWMRNAQQRAPRARASSPTGGRPSTTDDRVASIQSLKTPPAPNANGHTPGELMP